MDLPDNINPLSGLLKQEEEIHDHLMKVWSGFVHLEQTHPSDLEDVCAAVHKIQYVLGMRTLRRLFPGYWKTYKE